MTRIETFWNVCGKNTYLSYRFQILTVYQEQVSGIEPAPWACEHCPWTQKHAPGLQHFLSLWTGLQNNLKDLSIHQFIKFIEEPFLLVWVDLFSLAPYHLWIWNKSNWLKNSKDSDMPEQF